MKKSLTLPLVAALVMGSLLMPSAQATNQVPPVAWISDAVIYEVNVRQYTDAGTFDAFAEELPRLKELGVEVLWFMPIHEISVEQRIGTLGSYYSIADFRSINPEFGNAQDFRELVQQAQQLGFKVMMDWVANHTGWDHDWITENPDWYTQNSDGEIVAPPGTTWFDVADLNFANADMREAMLADMEYWVEEFDIDGYRMDYTTGVPNSFWRTVHTRLNQIKPVLILAENHSDLDLLNDAFDMNYNWPLKDIMNNFGTTRFGARNLNELIAAQKNQYPANTFAMNFITNHDENSWNGTEYERLGKLVPAMTAMYFALPGVPLIYSGQEIGLKKRLEFFEKDPIDWAGQSTLTYLPKLIDVKKNNSALDVGAVAGSINTFNTKSDYVVSFARRNGNDKVIYVGNISNRNQAITLKLGNLAGKYRSVINNTISDLAATQTFHLPPNGYLVFDSQTEGGTTNSPNSLSIQSAKRSFKVGQKVQLNPRFNITDLVSAKYKWDVITPGVVSISADGRVKALRSGSATVRLKAAGLVARIKLQVK